MAIQGVDGFAIDTTLNTALSATDLAAYLVDKKNWPNGSNDRFIIQVDSEYLLISLRVGNTLTVAQRGYNGTTPATHAAAATVTVLGYETIRTAFDAPGFLATTSSAVAATGLTTFENNPTSANFAALMTDESGTGALSFNTNGSIGGYTSTATAAATTALVAASTDQQEFTGTTTQIVTMPDVTTLKLGRNYVIPNKSTGVVTVNSSGGNLIYAIPANTTVIFRCEAITGTTAAAWDFDVCGKSVDIVDISSAQTLSNKTFASPVITGVTTSGGTDTSGAATVTTPSVSSGVAFTPSATQNAQVTFQFAAATGSYDLTYGPTTGAENTLASAAATLIGEADVVSFMVPKGWKVVLTLTTVTLAATLVTTF